MTKFYLYQRRYLLAVLLMLTSMVAWSQSRTVTGKVTSADDGTGLPGVNILVKGTGSGTATDASGAFSISASDNDVLVFSFVGYATQEVTVGSQSSITVSLQTDVTALSEVVVIGYGTVRVKDATGAVAAVSSEDFNGGMISSPEQLIQGKTAGVQMTSTSGEPGAGVQLRIRGTNSIRSNNNPLFVVDGVPLAGGTQPSSADVGYGSQQDTNPMNFINPNDIASMSILKDASATAIYGSRGANGVVIITTKSGKGGKAGVFDFSSSVSISSPRETYDLLDPTKFLAGVTQFGGDAVAQNKGFKTDWQDVIFRTAVSSSNQLAYSKGFETGSVRVSVGYDAQNGIIENSSMKRLTGRVNGNKTFLDNKLNLDLTTTFSNVKREDPAVGASAGFQGDILGAAYSANPTWDNDPDFNTGGQRNPANMLAYYQSEGTTNRSLNSLSASYKINSALTAKATYGLDWSKGTRTTLASAKAINAGNGVQGFGMGQLNENRNTNNLLELTLNYTKTVGKVAMEVVGGYSVQSFHNEWSWATGRGFDSDNFGSMETQLQDSFDAADAAASGLYDTYNNWGVSDDLRNGTQSTGGFVSGIDFAGDGTLSQSYFARPAGVTVDALAANFYDQTDYLQSYFGRGNFTISDKYLVTATVRVDGSSKFGDDNKYGVFPSAAVAWKISEEAFMPDAISTFKLRAGYGIVGNQDGLSYGDFLRRARWNDASVGDARQVTVPGSGAQGFANNSLKWEQTAQTSVGIDFGFLNEKFSGSFDVYVKNTTDLLLKYLPAQPSLATQIFGNLDATVENKGWEFSLAYAAIDKTDASLTISGNVSHNENMVKDLKGEFEAGTIRGQGLSLAYAQRLAANHPLFSYYLREFEGFDSNGQPIGDNQTWTGKTALPTWNYGININARYKRFDLTIYGTGQAGHYVYNNTANAFFTAGSINNARNVTPEVLTSGEAGSAEAAVSTRFLEKGNFFRLQNVSVGYNVGLGDMKFIKKLRFYVTGQNLLLITDYSGIDPEISSNPANFDLLNGLPTAGIDYTAYPRPRTFTIGLNASF